MRTLAAFLLGATATWCQTQQDLADGKATFRSNCAFCHGLTGGGGRGPALTSTRLHHGTSDDDIKTVIRNGVAGTNMPAFEFEKDELDRLVSYIRSLSGPSGTAPPLPGDAVQGRLVYQRSGCVNCHRIGQEGSIYGPDLSRIGAGRSAEYIRESVLNPSADIPEEYAGVTVVTRDGRRITGVRINEDTFTVQLRDSSQNFRMFQKDEVAEVIHETKSLMPPYASLAKGDLENLLAYLDSLRGDVNPGGAAKKAEGIR